MAYCASGVLGLFLKQLQLGPLLPWGGGPGQSLGWWGSGLNPDWPRPVQDSPEPACTRECWQPWSPAGLPSGQTNNQPMCHSSPNDRQDSHRKRRATEGNCKQLPSERSSLRHIDTNSKRRRRKPHQFQL